MIYCSRCGKSLKEIENFCSECGTKVKEFVDDVKEETEKIVKKTGHKGFVIFILFLMIIGYVILDIWAISQLTPVLSFDSLLTSISNFEGSTSYTSGSVASTIRLENPTFVPIIGKVVYEAGYGSTKIAEGETNLFIIGPYSEEDIPADLEVSYIAGGISLLKGIKNLITGQKERKYIDVYANIFVTKFKIGTLE